MPVNQLINPAYFTQDNLSGLFTAPFIATGTIKKGEIVQLVTGIATTKALKVVKATVTENYLAIGVATKAASTGEVVNVTTYGPALVLVKTAITKADAVVQTGVNAGYGKSIAAATAKAGNCLGVWLASLAATYTTQLVAAYIRPF